MPGPVETLREVMERVEGRGRWSSTDYVQAVEAVESLASCRTARGLPKVIRNLEMALVDLLGVGGDVGPAPEEQEEGRG